MAATSASNDLPGLLQILESGNLTVYVLLFLSLVVWAVIFERLWRFKRLGNELRTFHLDAVKSLMRGEWDGLRSLCQHHRELPTAKLVSVGLERLASQDDRLRSGWLEAVERRRQLLNQDLRRNLWVLGTIGSSAPFIGLFGTVVGILQSFRSIARSGTGGFAIVASGISEALIATATGIIVAVIAVMAYNAFQTWWSSLVLMIKIQTEELTEMLGSRDGANGPRESGNNVRSSGTSSAAPGLA